MSLIDAFDSALVGVIGGLSLLVFAVFCGITLVVVPAAAMLGRWSSHAASALAARTHGSSPAAEAPDSPPSDSPPSDSLPEGSPESPTSRYEAAAGANRPIAGARRAAAVARPRRGPAGSGPGGRGQLGKSPGGEALPPRVLKSLMARAGRAKADHGSQSAAQADSALPWIGM